MRKNSSSPSSSSLLLPPALLLLLLAISLLLSATFSELRDRVFYSRTARLLHDSAALHCDDDDNDTYAFGSIRDDNLRNGSRSGSIERNATSSSGGGGGGSESCPAYFHHIRDHLAPWSPPLSGISRPGLDRHGRLPGTMRIAIVGGKVYARAYGDCPQSRGVFSLWGLLLLLERFGDAVPDVEFVLNCKDRPVLDDDRCRSAAAMVTMAPVVSYCSHRRSLDIPFPDYSFWGWPEVNIRAWGEESLGIFRGSSPWNERQPVAFWKGNLRMGNLRKRLLRCNYTGSGTLVYDQNWIAEANTGYENSKLCNQCNHRFNIYAEGAAWSASLKYRMACASTMLYVDSEYHEFFTPGLIPNVHFVPISSAENKMCQELKAAVEWGNSHPHEAARMGRDGQDFVRQQVNIDTVYNYMLHLLTEYAKLQTFTPRVPKGAQLICKRAIQHILTNSGKEHYLGELTVVKDQRPCTMSH